MALLRNIFTGLLLILCASFVIRHHGWANYDQKKVLDYTGTIQSSVYENPHTSIQVTQDKKVWTVILAPVSRMEARGVTADMIKKGTSLRVVGYPHKTVKNEMRAERIFIDGTKYELR
ncbi:hypothetical protein HB364_21350 [Pseudoflavitalea sp. X16]|uniref:DUF6152 family protein n=1 Tax=Paraflavitalea devenefica TaxID=2716334 RepID=UPI001423ADB1|nr:DUF6152 family protein [Paraflavitalea devenefica]NII27643.1 hypothetical protein [Paraflavitalea devenefica]